MPASVPIEASYFANAVEVVFHLPFSIEGVGSTQRKRGLKLRGGNGHQIPSFGDAKD